MGRDAGLTVFHLVRHAEHGLLGQVLTGRMPGVGLSEAGRAQAQRLAATLASRAVAAVLSSPVQRARETAAPIAARHGLAVEIDPGFDEIDFGHWTGRPFIELDGDPSWTAWNSFRSTAACPGGEAMLAAQFRAVRAIAALRDADAGGEIVIVSHQDVLKSVLAHFLGVPLDLFQRVTLDPAHRSVLALWEDGVRADGINLPPG